MATTPTRSRAKARRSPAARWWVLLTQLPTRPAYLRVKLSRRLARLGAVAVKHAVYVLPRSDQACEDFQWLVKEIRRDGGEASLIEARLVDGLTDRQVRALFVEARRADYRELERALRSLRVPAGETGRKRALAELARLRGAFDELRALEFFPTGRRGELEALFRGLEARMRDRSKGASPAGPAGELPRGRTWVTRRGLKVDRLASAWLIRRFVDPEARFRFVDPDGFRPRRGEVRFDMFEAEFTHDGDRCTFEVLLGRLPRRDRALSALGEIVHDVDVKDQKFGRAEAPGLGLVVEAIARSSRHDEERLERGEKLFDGLYQTLGNGPA